MHNQCTSHYLNLCGHWCLGAKAPDHQYPKCWRDINCIGPVSYSNITFKWNNIRKWNYILNNKNKKKSFMKGLIFDLPDSNNSPRDHFVNAPNQWETTLQCNVVSHWLGAYTKWPLLSMPCYVHKNSPLGDHYHVARMLHHIFPLLQGKIIMTNGTLAGVWQG